MTSYQRDNPAQLLFDKTLSLMCASQMTKEELAPMYDVLDELKELAFIYEKRVDELQDLNANLQATIEEYEGYQ